MGKANINDILRRVEQQKQGKPESNSRDADFSFSARTARERTFGSRREPGGEFRSRRPMEDHSASSPELLAKIKKLKADVKSEDCDLAGFLKFLGGLGAFDKGIGNIRLEYSGRHRNADLFIPSLSVGGMGEEAKREIEGFFKPRYISMEYNGVYDSRFLKVWRTSDGYKVHLRFPTGEMEFEQAKMSLGSPGHGQEKAAERTFAGLIKFIDDQGWANRGNKIELFPDRKTNRGVFVVGDFDGDVKNDDPRRIEAGINRVAAYLASRYGAGKEKLEHNREKWWWGVVEGDKVVVGIKAPKIEDYNASGRKLLVYMDISTARGMAEFGEAQELFGKIEGKYELKDDPKHRKVSGFLEILDRARKYDGEKSLGKEDIGSLELGYEDGVLTLAGNCKNKVSIENMGKYFSERFRVRKQDEKLGEFRSEKRYDYSWQEGEITHEGGKEVPACYFKCSPWSFNDDGIKLRLSDIPVEEYLEAKAKLREMKGGLAQRTAGDFVESAVLHGVLAGREDVSMKYEGDALTVNMLDESDPDSSYGLSNMWHYFMDRFGPESPMGFDEQSHHGSVWKGNPDRLGRQSCLKKCGYEGEYPERGRMKYELVLYGVKPDEAEELGKYLAAKK